MNDIHVRKAHSDDIQIMKHILGEQSAVQDAYGVTSNLSPQDINDLTAFVQSIE